MTTNNSNNLVTFSVTKPTEDASVGLSFQKRDGIVIISKIESTGLFGKHKGLHPGMRVVSINGIQVVGWDIHTVVDIIRQISGNVDLTVRENTAEQRQPTHVPIAIATPIQTTQPTRATVMPTPTSKVQVFGNPSLITTQRTTLIVKEKISWGGDDFSIKDTVGNVWFRVRGRAFSLREKKVLHDSHDQPIWVMKDQFQFGPNPYALYLPHNKHERIAVIEPKWTFWKAKMTTYVVNQSTGTRTLISLKGDPMSRSCVITLGDSHHGEPIAHIQRVLGAGDFFWGKQTYHLTIEPGVDAAMMVALCVSFDELANDDRR